MWATHDDIDLELVVISTVPVADRVRLVTLQRADGDPLPSWSAGAHIDLTVGAVTRQYSLCGSPGELTSWQVAVLREEGSRGGSAYLHDVAVGATLAARGPRNHFPLEEAPHYLFVAGGIGITPLLPMIEEVDARGLPWALVYGGRTRTAMAFATALAERHPDRVELLPEDEYGPLSIARLMQLGQGGTAIYCCGPEGLVAAVEAMHARTRRGSLHVERFSPREPAEAPSSSSFEVEAARSGRRIVVHAGTSILDALEGVGVRVLSSCREGICGTCEVFVLDGTPEHRDSILSAEERQTSETMFVCVSRCLSPRLVLDV